MKPRLGRIPGSHTQAVRCLRIVARLTSEWTTRKDLAYEHGVDTRTITRDLDAILASGLLYLVLSGDVARPVMLRWRRLPEVVETCDAIARGEHP